MPTGSVRFEGRYIRQVLVPEWLAPYGESESREAIELIGQPPMPCVKC